MKNIYLLLIYLPFLLFFSCTEKKSHLSFKWSNYTDSLLNDTTKLSVKTDSLRRRVLKSKNDTVALNNLSRLAFTIKPPNLVLPNEVLNKSISLKFEKGEVNAFSLIGTYYYKKGNFSMADSFFTLSVNLADKINYKVGKLHPLCYKAAVYYLAGDFKGSKPLCDEGLLLAKQLHNRKYEGLVYGLLGELAARDADHKKAVYYYKKGIEAAREIKDSSRIAYCLTGLGSDYRMQSDNYTAINYFNEALTIQQNLKEEASMSYLLNNMAMLYLVQNDHPQAINNYNRAIAIAEKNGDNLRLAYCYHQMADIYSYRNEIDTALLLQTKALDIANEKNEKGLIGGTLKSLSEIYQEKNDTVKSNNYIRAAIKVLLEIEDKQSVGQCYATIANNYSLQNQHEKAVDALEKAKFYSGETNDKNSLSVAYRTLAREFLLMHRPDEALKAAEQALSIARETNIYDNIKKAAFVLHEIYLQKKLPERSLEMYKLYSVMKDSLLNEAQLKKVAAAEYKGKEEKMRTEEAAREKTFKIEQEKNEQEIKNQKFVRNASLVGILLLGLLTFFVFRNLQQNKKAKKVIELQKEIVEGQKKEIIDSINYARRIQYTLLAHDELLQNNLNEHFILFKPKDIVSGDFYWATKKENYFYLAVCDSTGHGVPGAFMSLLNISFLNEAINEKNITSPNQILNHVRSRLIESMDGGRDGMDAILLCFDKSNNTITYSAGNNQPVLIKNNQVVNLPKDKMPVGKGEKEESFNLYSVHYSVGDKLFIYTDGYADQFGGPKGKKFKYKDLNQLLLENSSLPFSKQSELLDKAFVEWKGNMEQVDDVCIIGIKV